MLVISPLRRTLQTAYYWSEGINCKKTVNPLVSPRIFPPVTEGKTLPCDELLERKKIVNEFPGFQLENDLSEELWNNGINTIPNQEFQLLAEKFLKWCRLQVNSKIYIVSHEGTITSFRQIITGKKLSRDDFLGEASWLNMNY